MSESAPEDLSSEFPTQAYFQATDASGLAATIIRTSLGVPKVVPRTRKGGLLDIIGGDGRRLTPADRLRQIELLKSLGEHPFLKKIRPEISSGRQLGVLEATVAGVAVILAVGGAVEVLRGGRDLKHIYQKISYLRRKHK